MLEQIVIGVVVGVTTAAVIGAGAIILKIMRDRRKAKRKAAEAERARAEQECPSCTRTWPRWHFVNIPVDQSAQGGLTYADICCGCAGMTKLEPRPGETRADFAVRWEQEKDGARSDRQAAIAASASQAMAATETAKPMDPEDDFAEAEVTAKEREGEHGR